MRLLRPLLAAVAIGSCFFGCSQPSPAADSDSFHDSRGLRIGAVLDLTGALAEHGADAEMGAQLAIEHINQAGGVGGRPVELFVVDGATDPSQTVVSAERLRSEHQVDVLVGAMGSEATLGITRQISIPHRLPTISPSATAPQLSTLVDDGYVFRAVLSDAAQGPVLAELATREGYSEIAVIYRDDAYGQGLLGAFTHHFTGRTTAIRIDPSDESFLEPLAEAGAGGAQALLLLTFPVEAEILIREATARGLFDRFLFGDGARSPELIEQVGANVLEGMKGTVPAMGISDGADSTQAFLKAFEKRFSMAPKATPALATYDSVICFALAAEAARSLDGAAIRDALPRVCTGPGERFVASADSVADALQHIREGGTVDYDGAASTMDWDASGDIINGQIAIWEYQGGEIVTLQHVRYGSGGGDRP